MRVHQWLYKWMFGREYDEPEDAQAFELCEMLTRVCPQCIVYEIDNGYVVLTTDEDAPSRFVYCQNHHAVAAHLAAQAAETKLGTQLDLFDDNERNA